MSSATAGGDGGVKDLLANVGRTVVGKEEPIKLVLTALLCGGHVLIEDVPGVGKTLLAKSLAASLDCSFRRLQFTPDMLPSDITGSHVFNQQRALFEFRPGPIFTNVLLADEVNRATPRTQSALLEAMEEQQVSVDGETMRLSRPFLVMATQNPIELEGTFPLPEAQLDRFLLKVRMGYPSEEEELKIVERFAADDPLPSLKPVLNPDAILALQQRRAAIKVVEDVRRYIVSLARATRGHPDCELGASPRAALALFRASQARALIEGREFVLPDDAKRLAVPVLSHRILLNAGARLRGTSAEGVVEQAAAATEVPVEAI